MSSFQFLRALGARCGGWWAIACLAVSSLPASAALTDLSSTPITNSTAAQAKPNIMLLMDTSGSMGWGHMPDEVETITGINSIGYKAAQCNALYYNPNTTYGLPRRADGSFFPTPNFTSASYDVYNSASSTTVNLSSAFKAFDSNTLRTAGYEDTPQAAYYYVYAGSQSLDYSTAPCTDLDTNVSKSTIGGNWTRVVVGSSERQNFANWYTYYRTRMALTKSAVSLAFTPLTESFRIGFITMQAKDTPTDTSINANKYLAINDFNTTQRGLWFNKLFSQTPGGSSPAREGLARVGRHYAGRTDGINSGMTGDPVQYSCQQNFTIMTTDGYWNDQAETPGDSLGLTPSRGPVRMDGTTRVGQLDATLTNNDGLTPRPIWEGFADTTRTSRDKKRNYSYAACTSNYFNVATLQVLRSTTQVRQSTSQLTRSTTQNQQSTQQNLQSTTQNLRSTTQNLQSTQQDRSSTIQRLRSTTQNLRSTLQTTQTTTQTTQTVTRMLQSTTQNLQSTTQTRQSTSQLTRSTTQDLQSTSQILRSTVQMRQSTSQLTRSTTQDLQSTTQVLRSTTQNLQSTSQVRQSTVQVRSCNANTELCTPVASCTPGGLITCENVTTGPTLVASCTPAAAAAGNNYTTTSCATTNITSNAPVASCTNTAASSGNSFTTTSCSTNNTSNVPVASCAISAANSSNGYTTTSCPTPITTGPTPVATCTNTAASSGNSFTSISCSTNNTGPTGVASCTASAGTSGNSYVDTTCNTVTTGPTGVASCTQVTAGSGNSYTATTCAPNNTTNVPVASCSASSASSGNGYTTTSCPTPVTTGPTPVVTCTSATANSSNSFTTTTCSTNNTGPTGVASCTASAGTSGNSYVDTTCNTVTTGPTGVATCTPVSAGGGNSYTATTCAPNNTTNVPVASCSASGPTSGNGYTTTSCSTNNTSNVAVASCTASSPSSGNGYTTTTCNNSNVSGPTPVASCVAVAPTSGNGFQRTTCNTTNPTVGVATCVSQSPNAGNNYTTIACGNANTSNVPVASCSASGPTSGNSYVTTTCSTNNTSNVPVASCAASSPTSGNGYTTTTCPTANTTGPTPTASCTAVQPSSGNNYTETTCSSATTGPTPVASCTPVTESALNSYTATTCSTSATSNTPVASCSISGPTSGNSYVTTTCSTNNTANVPVGTCTPTSPTSGNGFVTTTCPTPVTTAPVPVGTCTPVAASSGNNWTATLCPGAVTTGPTGVASCSVATAASGNNWTTTSCNTVSTGPTGVASCTNAPADGGNSYVATSCNTVTSGPTGVASCAPAAATSGNSYVTTTCSTNAPTPTIATTCSAVPAAAGNSYTATTCTPVLGQKIRYVSTLTTTTTPYSGGTAAGPEVVTAASDPAVDVDGTCYITGAGPSLPALPSPNPQSAPADGTCAAWPCSADTSNVGGSINSLADVAQYYYTTDLRPGMTDDVPSIGSGPEDDRARWQHMTTFSIALGVSGTLDYRSDYRLPGVTTGDFADIRNPAVSKAWPLWPDPNISGWDATRQTYTNKTLWNDARSIDDFWHAAVNGRGQFFSARNPSDVVSGIAGALAGIQARLGGAAAGTSTQAPVAGNNFAYTANYTTSQWVGDVEARLIDLSNGLVSTASSWSAQALLDGRVNNACDTRSIYLMRQGATNNLTPFTWNSQACDSGGLPTGTATTGLNSAEQAYFDVGEVALLSQYPSMTDGTAPTVNQRTPAAGANLVNYLRGQRGFEGFVTNDVNKLYRTRTHILGDVINGQPVYVKVPFARYQDPGYLDFKSANANRTAMVYVPANDGMLHAFYAETNAASPAIVGGKEAWAVIPTTVLPNLYKLADNNYGNLHQYSVDGVPSIGDAYDPSNGGNWKTILVGGFNSGGKGYYAMDVTDPASPKGLWEFKWSSTCYNSSLPATANADCHLGYTFGKPIITKLANGTWVVLVTSGFNNVNTPSQGGDGQGYLYVLNAFSGNIMYKISTGQGDATTPSGLVHINNFVDNAAINNTTLRVYGGDVLGNVWRFDINDNVAPSGREATLLGVARDSNNNRQPITTRPELAELNNSPMVFVATGRLLGATDLADTHTQSVYGLLDPLNADSPAYSNLRNALKPRALTQVGVVPNASRTVACPDTATAAQCGATAGWVLDLPDPGERVNVDMKLFQGTLVIGSNVPQSTACTAGGYSWLTNLNYSSGLGVTSTSGGTGGSSGTGGTGGAGSTSGSGVTVSQYVSNSLIIGLTVVRLPTGEGKTILSTSGGGAGTAITNVTGGSGSAGTGTGSSVPSGCVGGGGGTATCDPPPSDPPAFGKRISWREIVTP